MSDDSTTQCLLFPVIFRKPIVAQFDQREGSSDGGALLLKAADRHYGLVARVTSAFEMIGERARVDHSLRELVAQRVFAIAWATRTPTIQAACPRIRFTNYFWIAIRSRVALWLRSRRCRVSRTEFGSGTLSFGRVDRRECDPASRQAAASSHLSRHHRSGPDRRSHARRAAVVVLQRTLRHLVLPAGDGFCQLQTKPNSISRRGVRPGNVSAAAGAVGLLRRLVRMIRHSLSGVQIRVRLDGGFAHPAVRSLLDAQPNLEYVVAMARIHVVEARGQKRNAASAPALAAQRKDRTYLRGSPLQGREVARPAPRHHRSRGCPRSR